MSNCYLVTWIPYCRVSFQVRAHFSPKRYCCQCVMFPLFHPPKMSNCSLALKTLATDKDLVHHDISYNSIPLLDQDPTYGDSNENHCCSLLIDLEYAASMVTAQAMAPGWHTVSTLFLSYHFSIFILC